MPDSPRGLVVGTGNLGGRVVRELVHHGTAVRVLVRKGSDTTRLAALGVELARGDLVDAATCRLRSTAARRS
jgi:uncharacterized protein YbjT (DUF2867 family)